MFGSKVLGVTALSLTLAAMAFGANRVGPVSQYGQLQAGKNSSGKGQIYGACKGVTSGNEVQVQGMSLFWSTAGNNEGEQFWNASTVNTLVKEHNIQLIRAPMGVDENWNNGKGNYGTNKDYHQKMMNEVVQAAIDNDIYVIIDYHSHNAIGSKSTAATFFEDMASKWGKYDNVIFEVFNEPLEGVSWSSIKSYAEDMLKIIRKYSDNLVVVGNRSWDQYPNDAASSPINDKNVAYTFHFYAGDNTTNSEWTHRTTKEGANAVSAMNSGLSVFVTEWGNSEADGNGGNSDANSATWLSWMNQHKLSGANWSVNTKDESASYFSGSAWNYSASGNWVNTNIFSKLPKSYTACSAGGNTPASSSSVASSSSKALPAGYTDYIDDFEDGDSLAYTGGVWYAYNDNENGAASSFGNATNKDGFKVVLPGSTAGNSTKNVAGLTGVKLNKGTYEYDPFVALGVKLNADESAYDLTSCGTISYKYKGAAHNFKAEDAGVKDYGYHQISKTASSSWTEASVDWGMLLQESWADPVSISKSRINKFTWEIKGTQPSLNYLYIDDVRCDGIAIKKATVSSSSSSAKSSSSMSSSSAKSSSSVSSSSARSSSSVSSSSAASSSSASLAWAGNAQLSDTSATGVKIGQSNGYSPDRVISKGIAVTAGEVNVLTFKMKLSEQGPLNISTNIESCREQTSVNTSDVNVTCSFTPASNVSTLTLTVPGGTWQTVTVSDLSVSVRGATVETVFTPAAANTTQNVVAGQAITPIVYNFENVTNVSVTGLPKGLNAVLNEKSKTYTISGTVDATLTDHDYEYTVTVTGVDENTTATGTIKVAHKPVVTVFNPAAANTTQEVVAGQAITPIVYNFENVTNVSVTGLPKGLSAVLNEKSKTYTISGTVDATLTDHDYEYTVTVTGVDENTTATGTIKVAHKPVVTVFNPAAANTTQNVVAGQAITPIVYNFENVKNVSVTGLPMGLNAVLDEKSKTYTISGTVDATLTDHDYEYTVTVTGVDENTTATGTIKVAHKPVVTVFNPAAANTTQNVVAGQAITPIVYNFENVTNVSVTGLPKGLNAVLNEKSKTYTISGTVDATLTDHDYEYTVTVTGVDENTTATGTIKVAHKPVVTTIALTSGNANQNVIAGEAIVPIVFSYENVTEISVTGLPEGLNGSLDKLAGTYVINGSVDEKLSTHDYDYTVTFFGVDENKTASGTIKVTELEESSSSEEPQQSSSSVEPEVSSSSEEPEESSSSVELSSSSVTEISSSSEAESSSSVVTESSSSSEVIEESSSSEEPQQSSSSVEPEVSSSSEEPEESSSSVELSSSSVTETSSSSDAESSSSVVTESSSSSEAIEESSSSEEPQQSSSSVEPEVSSSSEEPEESSSSVELSSSSAAEISSSSDAESSSSSAEVSSSSVQENLVVVSGDLSQSVRQNEAIAPVIISGVEKYERKSYNAYWLEFTLNGSELTVSGTTPMYFNVGSYSETFTVNGETYSIKLDVAAYVSSSSVAESSSSVVTESSSSSEAIEVSSSSEEPEISSSSTDPETSSSSDEDSDFEEDPTVVAKASASFKMGFARNVLTVASANSASFKIQVFDLMGHAVVDQREVIAGSYDLDLSSLNRGGYLVRVTSGSSVRSTRINVR